MVCGMKDGYSFKKPHYCVTLRGRNLGGMAAMGQKRRKARLESDASGAVRNLGDTVVRFLERFCPSGSANAVGGCFLAPSTGSRGINVGVDLASCPRAPHRRPQERRRQPELPAPSCALCLTKAYLASCSSMILTASGRSPSGSVCSKMPLSQASAILGSMGSWPSMSMP